jgi:hypothetical protein
MAQSESQLLVTSCATGFKNKKEAAMQTNKSTRYLLSFPHA